MPGEVVAPELGLQLEQREVQTSAVVKGREGGVGEVVGLVLALAVPRAAGPLAQCLRVGALLQAGGRWVAALLAESLRAEGPRPPKALVGGLQAAGSGEQFSDDASHWVTTNQPNKQPKNQPTKQTNKQTDKQPTNQTNKQTNNGWTWTECLPNALP